MALVMRAVSWAPKDRARWRLGTDDLSKAVFPSNEKLQELFETSCTEGTRGRIAVLDRGENYLIIETPSGFAQCEREGFAHKIWGEMYFP